MGIINKLKERKQRKVVFHEVEREGQKSITVAVPSEDRIEVANDSHPSYTKIVEMAKMDDPTCVDLIDTEAALARQFQALSDRVTIRDGKIFLDGDEVDNLLTQHILRTLEAGEDFKPLVLFFERLATNPLGHAKDALYPWLNAHGSMTITEEGKVVGYKAMQKETRNGEVYYRPTRKDGGALVNGIEVPAGTYLYAQPGDVVEMPRSIVLKAPSAACAEGLHIGDWGYARKYGIDYKANTMMEVHFDPRDVVSVPDRQESKIRVCRFTMVGPISQPHQQPVIPAAKIKPNAPKEQPVTLPKIPTTTTTFPNPTTTKEVKTTTTTKERVRYPRPAQFDALVVEAKSKKKGLQRYAEAKTNWKLVPGGDPKNRKDWRA